MTMLGGTFWVGNEVVSEVWQDVTGRPVVPSDSRAVSIKYHVGDTITDSDKFRLQAEYRQPDQVGPQSPP